jgi:hypothetical protein
MKSEFRKGDIIIFIGGSSVYEVLKSSDGCYLVLEQGVPFATAKWYLQGYIEQNYIRISRLKGRVHGKK